MGCKGDFGDHILEGGHLWVFVIIYRSLFYSYDVLFSLNLLYFNLIFYFKMSIIDKYIKMSLIKIILNKQPLK